MKAKDLRLGNLVVFKQSMDIHSISGTLENGETNSYEVDENKIDRFIEYSAPIDHYEPIPLTEKKLLEYDFKLLSQKVTRKGVLREFVKKGVRIELSYGLNFYYKGRKSLIIDHVHQLQNLYFALTGEELEINNNTRTGANNH